MGNKSSTSLSVCNDLAVNVSMDSIMSCSSAATQQQLIELKDVKGNVNISGVSMTQGASVNMSCVMDSVKQNEIAMKVSNALAQQAEASGQAVLSALGNTKANASANIHNKIMTNISANTTMEMSASVNQTQAITVANVGGNVVIANVSMEQGAQVIAQGLMKTQAYASVINEVATAMDQKSKSEEKNPIATVIDSIGKAVGTVMSAPILIFGGLIVGALVLFVLIKFVFKSGGSSSSAPVVQQSTSSSALPTEYLTQLAQKYAPSLSTITSSKI